MSALTAAVASSRELKLEWRRFCWKHPEWTLAVAVTAAWMAVFAMSANGWHPPESGAGVHAHAHLAVTPPAAPLRHAHPASGVHVSVMMVAMMLPTILPAARAVGLDGKWKRRQRGPALFAAGYLLIWITIGLAAAHVVTLLGAALTSRYSVATALVVAAGWELTPYKARCLRACCRIRPLPPDGWRADRMCVTGGIRHAIPCVGSCWALMLPTLFAVTVTATLLMMPTALAIAVQRNAARPRTLARPVAAGCLAAALLVALG